MSLKIWKFVCIVLLMVAGSTFWAQETEEESSHDSQTNSSEPQSKEPTNNESEEVDVEKTEEPPTDETETKTSEDTPDIFDPTENISEDYAVPFPVDI